MHRFIKQNKFRAVAATANPQRKQINSKQLRTTSLRSFVTARLAMAVVVVAVSLGFNSPTAFADVQTQISSREAYVGMPITLYVQVSGQGNLTTPEIPEVDGLDIRSNGTPSSSSRIMIINGRRTESSSVTYSFQVTPRREGTFQIPSFEINTGSGIERTRAVRFAATKSETGDLMFAEIEGNGEKVFVGQPIDSTLKIWIKPLVDRTAGIKLSPSQMWQLMSEQTEWGGFQSTLEEMAKNRQAVRGREVLREDNEGVERAYYLYEIEATIYPKSAGVLDSENVQLVYQYPLSIGQSRDPFDSFFEDSPFGGSSLASQFFSRNSGFGGRSPFGRSLTVTNARPIVVEPEVTDIEIAAVPTAGRPADYRGAVGQYAIVTQASPKKVKAGDPITLQIGIRGTGPMELVQAPPLHTIASLTNDFKVADESLAGVVRDDIKVFSTTIRPRSENVTQIPAIPFSFFDPDTQKFVTVKSDPISVEVDMAETLAIDSIVGRGKSDSSDPEQQTAAPESFRLENNQSDAVLSSATFTPTAWWWLALIPPGIWGLAMILKRRDSFSSVAVGRQLREIKNAQTASALAEAVQSVLQSSGDNRGATDSLQRTIPSNYTLELKNEIQEFYQDCDQAVYTGSGATLVELKRNAKQIVRNMPRTKSTGWQIPSLQNPVRTLASCGLAAAMIGIAVFTMVQSFNHSPADQVAVPTTAKVTLDQQQQQDVLEEANTAYVKAQSLNESDIVESKIAFESAAKKYQLLADSGIRNSNLYCNLGNAYLQQGKLGKAIASYETARRYDPANSDATHNLDLARQQIENDSSATESASGNMLVDLGKKAIAIVPPWSVWALFGIGWLAFWTVSASNRSDSLIPRKLNRAMIGTSVAMVLIGCSLIVVQSQTFDAMQNPIAVVTDMAADVRTGCGEEFQPATGFELTEGSTLRLLQQRGGWCQVETSDGTKGWIRNSDIEVVANFSKNASRTDA